MVHNFAMNQDLNTFVYIVSIFTLVAFFVHFISKHDKQIQYLKEYIMSKRAGLIIIFVLVLFIYGFYLYKSNIDSPTSVLFLLLFYCILKVLSHFISTDSFSLFAKGFCYGGLGLVNIYTIDNEHPLVSYFVATMCFFEFIDNAIPEFIKLLKLGNEFLKTTHLKKSP